MLALQRGVGLPPSDVRYGRLKFKRMGGEMKRYERGGKRNYKIRRSRGRGVVDASGVLSGEKAIAQEIIKGTETHADIQGIVEIPRDSKGFLKDTIYVGGKAINLSNLRSLKKAE